MDFGVIVLAFIQGISEFLPISSSAHLIIFRDLFGIGSSISSEVAMSFDIALHFGTLLAIGIYFFKDFITMIKNGLTKGVKDKDGKLFWYLVVATIPAGLVGVLFEDKIDELIRSNFIVIALALIFMGILIYVVDKTMESKKTVKDLTLKDAFLIGCSQVFALIPGFSRSGTTIAAGRALKLKKEDAAKFSFYLSAPVVLGAVLVQLLKEGFGVIALFTKKEELLMIGLLVTLGLGLFILIGAGIVFLTKNNQRFIEFSLSLALSVMIVLLFSDLLPESYELWQEQVPFMEAIIYLGVAILGGFLLLLVLDHFVPDHEDESTNDKEDRDHLVHIGFVSSIALILHNIIEGIAIFLITQNNLTSGLMASLGVGLHNIPLGMVIASVFSSSKKDKKKTIFMLILLVLSTFVGGVFAFVFGSSLPALVEAIALSLTSGMLLYIIVMELLPKVLHTKHLKDVIYGFLVGVIILLLTWLIS